MAKAKKGASASNGSRPTIGSCVEVVLTQSDSLINSVIDGLIGSSDRAANTMASQGVQNPAVLAAVGALDANRTAVAQKFGKSLRRLLYAGLGTAGQVRNVVRFEDLRLFEDEQLDDSIEIARAQQEVALTVERSLPQLDALISGLMGWITVQSEMNPLRPEVFIHALRDSIKEFVIDEDVRGQLITPAAGRLGVALDRLYRKVSDWLLMHGIEPAGPTLSGNTGAVTAAGGGVSSSVAKTMLTLDKLRRLLTGETQDQLPSDSMGKRGSGFLHTVPLSLKAIEDGNMVESMVERLSKQAEEDPEELRRRQEQAKQDLLDGKNIGKLLGEEVTRVMLDNLLQDQRLLPKVKTLLRALEPALLEMSKIDVRFFSDAEHPARQYLDMITDRAIGFAHEQDEGFPRFFKSIQDAIGEVVHEYAELSDKGEITAVFQLALENLLAVWDRTDALIRAQQEAAAKALLLAEQRNTEAQKLALEFRELLIPVKVHDTVRDFLTGVWSQVIAKAVVGGREDMSDPHNYRVLVDDLIWSAQPKVARKDRPRLMALIPGLLTKLRMGLRSIDYPHERVVAFFDELLKVHELALEGRPPKQQEMLYKPDVSDSQKRTAAGSSEESAPSSMYGPEDSRWGKDLEVQENNEATASAFIDFAEEEIKLNRLAEQSRSSEEVQGTAEPQEAEEDSLLDANEEDFAESEQPLQALHLRVGTWVEIKIKDRWTRAQLTWESPRKTMFVFVSGSGAAHSMTIATIEKLLGEGQIRLVADGRMVENALNAVADAALQNTALSQSGKASRRP